MDDRTINIILIVKSFNTLSDVKKYIAIYMGEECRMPSDIYKGAVLYSVVVEAYLDYLNCAEHERAIGCVRRFFNNECPKDDVDRMLTALRFIRVAERDEYGNIRPIDTWHSTYYTPRINDWANKHYSADQSVI